MSNTLRRNMEKAATHTGKLGIGAL